MADEEKKKTEEETTEDAEHKFDPDPDADACGVCGGCGGGEEKTTPTPCSGRAGLVKWYNISFPN